MRFPPGFLDEIRSRLPVSDVVRRRVKLTKAGREWKGLSPFNPEKSPSFFVNDQKGFYHCFSSGKHGDIFDFLMEAEGLPFPEAVEQLATLAGLELPRETPQQREQEERRKGLHEVMELAAIFFEKELAGRRGAQAREYLARRGVPDAMRERFRLGYSPGERYALRDHLAAKGVSTDLMIEAGLVVHGEDVKVPFDRFRDRLMFPIADLRARIVAFGGRALAADVPAKYLNSPDTPLFHKGEMLYNAHAARKAAHERGSVIAVEGYMDVIAMTACGLAHVVAPLGTALTEQQMALLWRLADEPILCFDGDKAGRRAAFRALDVILPQIPIGKSARFAIMPEGQDPDDLSRSGGASAIERVLAAALPVADLLWKRESEAGPLETPEHRAGFERRLHAAIGTIRDPVLQRHFRDDVNARLRDMRGGPARQSGERSRGGRRDMGQARFGAGQGQVRPGSRLPDGYRPGPALLRSGRLLTEPQAALTHAPPREAAIVRVYIAHPALLAAHAEEISALDLVSAEAKTVRDLLLDCALDPAAMERVVIDARLARAGLAPLVAALEARMVPSLRWMLDENADLPRVEDALRQAITLHRRAHTLHSELVAVERALADDSSDMNLARLREIKRQLSTLEGTEAQDENS